MATEPKDLVRILIPDNEAVFGDAKDEYLFEDADIEKFLEIANGSILRAAGLAMIAVGNSEALISKVIQTQDLKTDGSKLQSQWRESGQAMFDRADKEDAQNAAGYFDIIDYGEGWGSDRAELTEHGFVWP